VSFNGVALCSICAASPVEFSNRCVAWLCRNHDAFYDLAFNKIAEFSKYDSPIGLGIPLGVFSSDDQRMRSLKDGTRMGDERKAVG
jgi:hypothetical protein